MLPEPVMEKLILVVTEKSNFETLDVIFDEFLSFLAGHESGAQKT